MSAANRLSGLSRLSTEKWRARAAIVVAAVLVGGPITIVVGSATGILKFPGQADEGTGLGPFRAIMRSYPFWTDIFHTLLLAVGGCVGATVVGTTLAFLLTRTNMPGARGRALSWVPLLSFLLPSVLVFFAWHVLYASRAGLVNIWLRKLPGAPEDVGPLKLLSVPWLIGAMTVLLVPIIFISVRGALAAASPELEQAARGQRRIVFKVVRTVTLPLIKPAIGAGALLGFVIGLGVYVIPALLRVPNFGTLSINMKRSVSTTPQAYSHAAAWSIVLLVFALTALMLRQRWVGYQTASMPLRQSASNDSNKRVDIGRWRWAGLGVFVIYGLLGGILPVVSVFLLSLRGFWGTSFDKSDFSLKNYRNFSDVAPHAIEGLTNSIIVGTLGATVATFLGLWFARRVVAGGRRGRLLEMITFLPSGIPHIIIGLSVLIGAIKYAPAVYGGLIPLLLAYVILFLPFSVQIPLAALRRVPREFEWASAVSGATRRGTMRRIVLPLVAVDLVGAWTLVAVMMVREVEASVMLSSNHFYIAGPEMLVMWTEGLAPAAAAFGMVLLCSTLGVALFGASVVGTISTVGRVMASRRVRAATATTTSDH